MRILIRKQNRLTIRYKIVIFILSKVSVGVFPNLIGRFYFDQKRRELLAFVRMQGRLLRSVGHNSRLFIVQNSVGGVIWQP